MSSLLIVLALFLQTISGGSRKVFTPSASTCTSGACSDNFSGTAGTLLATHDPNWADVNSGLPTSNMHIDGTGQAYVSGPFNSGGGVYMASTSDTSKVVMVAYTTDGTAKAVCVRCGGGNLGYSISLAGATGSDWTNLALSKNGSFFDAVLSGVPWAMAADHTVMITVSGTTTVTISMYVDGALVGTRTDSSSPVTGGHPGFYISGNGSATSNFFRTWQDHP